MIMTPPKKKKKIEVSMIKMLIQIKFQIKNKKKINGDVLFGIIK